MKLHVTWVYVISLTRPEEKKKAFVKQNHHDRCSNNKFKLLNGWQWTKYDIYGMLLESACDGVVCMNDQLFQNNNDFVKAFRTWTESIKSISDWLFPREVNVTT